MPRDGDGIIYVSLVWLIVSLLASLYWLYGRG